MMKDPVLSKHEVLISTAFQNTLLMSIATFIPSSELGVIKKG